MPELPCPMHAQLEHKIDAIALDIKSMLEAMSEFKSGAAVRATEIVNIKRDIDALWTDNRDLKIEIDKRLERIEKEQGEVKAIVQQLEGMRKTVVALWLVFGGAILASAYAVARHFITIN